MTYEYNHRRGRVAARSKTGYTIRPDALYSLKISIEGNVCVCVYWLPDYPVIYATKYPNITCAGYVVWFAISGRQTYQQVCEFIG